MQLIKRYLDPGAVVNFTQLGHRHTAIEYAIAGIAENYQVNLERLGSDPLTRAMEGSMREWVVETLFQGAYLREYHLWEKDCKAYFGAMAKRNGCELALRTKGGQTFTKLIEDMLAAFDVAMPVETMLAIEAMRQRVNVMKHEAGLELDHFISTSEYADAIYALEKFWEFLATREKLTG